MKLLIVLLDAFRFDYLHPNLSPCLHKIVKEGFHTRLETLLGYSSGIHPSIWTGVRQCTHGQWTKYIREERSQSFARGLFYYLPSKILKYGIKYMLKMTKHSSTRGRVDDLLPGLPASISSSFIVQPWSCASPLDYTKYFSRNQLRVPTLFDILQENNIPYTYSFFRNAKAMLAENPWTRLTRETSKLDFFLITSPDELGHRYGPFSTEMKEELRKLDSQLGKLIKKTNHYRDTHIILFSDHGMTTINKLVNIQKLLKRSNLSLGKDYIAFHDATLSRFWPFGDSAREKMVSLLDTMSFGKVLTPSDLKMYGINFDESSKRKFGELIFLVNPGVYIFPNYLHSIKANHMKAVHGYDPAHDSSYGIFVYYGSLNEKFGNIKQMSIIDIFPTILDILDLPTPGTCEGFSVLKRKR